MSLPGTYNLQIYQGQTYEQTFTWLAGTCCGTGTLKFTTAPSTSDRIQVKCLME